MLLLVFHLFLKSLKTVVPVFQFVPFAKSQGSIKRTDTEDHESDSNVLDLFSVKTYDEGCTSDQNDYQRGYRNVVDAF